MYFLLFRPKAAKSAPLQGLVNARSIVVLIVSSQRDRESEGPINLSHAKTWLTSHTELCLGLGGLLLKTPFSMRAISGCFATSHTKMAELYVVATTMSTRLVMGCHMHVNKIVT